MTNEQIDTFLTEETRSKLININFKSRNTIQGIFLAANDYEDLKSKNLWRIVTSARLEDYRKTNNLSVSRIYNGSDFTKLKICTSELV